MCNDCMSQQGKNIMVYAILDYVRGFIDTFPASPVDAKKKKNCCWIVE